MCILNVNQERVFSRKRFFFFFKLDYPQDGLNGHNTYFTQSFTKLSRLTLTLKSCLKPGMILHTLNARALDAEVGGSLTFEVSVVYTVPRPARDTH